MKKLKIFGFLLICVMMMGVICGCSSDNDVQMYLQALLDNSYKNDSKVFVDMKLGTAEEAQALYEQGIDIGTDAFCSKLNIPDELKEDFRQIYTDMLKKVRYTVNNAEKQSDGSYIVTVSYEKMKVFEPSIEAYQKNAAQLAQSWTSGEGAALSDEEIRNQILLELKKSMETALLDVEYDETAATTIRIELSDNVYTPNMEDISQLEKLLFDAE